MKRVNAGHYVHVNGTTATFRLDHLLSAGQEPVLDMAFKASSDDAYGTLEYHFFLDVEQLNKLRETLGADADAGALARYKADLEAAAARNAQDKEAAEARTKQDAEAYESLRTCHASRLIDLNQSREDIGELSESLAACETENRAHRDTIWRLQTQRLAENVYAKVYLGGEVYWAWLSSDGGGSDWRLFHGYGACSNQRHQESSTREEALKRLLTEAYEQGKKDASI